MIAVSGHILAVYKRVLSQNEVIRVFREDGWTQGRDGVFRHKQTGLHAINPLMILGYHFFAGERDEGENYDFELIGTKPVKDAEELRRLNREAVQEYQASRKIEVK